MQGYEPGKPACERFRFRGARKSWSCLAARIAHFKCARERRAAYRPDSPGDMAVFTVASSVPSQTRLSARRHTVAHIA